MSLDQTTLNDLYARIDRAAPSGATQAVMLATDQAVGDAVVEGLIAKDVNDGGLAVHNAYDVVQIIQLATGGVPTLAQVAGWTAALNSGADTVQQMTDAFISSDAFAAHYGLGSDASPTDLATTSMVDQVIFNATQVNATPAQETGWTGQTLENLVSSFGVSDQAHAIYAPHVQDYFVASELSYLGQGGYPAGDLFSM